MADTLEAQLRQQDARGHQNGGMPLDGCGCRGCNYLYSEVCALRREVRDTLRRAEAAERELAELRRRAGEKQT